MTSTDATSTALSALSTGLADAVGAIAPTLVAVKGHRRFAYSGIHWQPGVIVTADYGLGRSSRLTLTLPDGNVVEAEVSGHDRALDLAIIQLDRTDLPVPATSDGADLKVGHVVLAVGQSWDYGVSASLGVVGNLGGPWQSSQGRAIDRLIRPDVNLYPNLLGGALVNTAGEVLGMNLNGPRNRVVTLPTANLDRIVKTLLERGSLSRGYLGVGLQPVVLPATLQQSLEAEVGLLVVSIDATGPAEQAGLLVGDILLAVNGQAVSNLQAVYAHLDVGVIGQPVSLHLLRGGQPTDLTLTVGEQPQGGGR
ncbi:S1C family serine protease [Leptolyngbya sp. CCNP1308]|uniref:S1C family serine protease n=1 Tax=Leptolyngbya sp. CCNP1308 TaxID=3110255 RepID=UPI002B1F6E06|nr:S1C family serine protease [Leptolyngbya sp. CCNP1308]MEA5452786.1 S1C family serine protease [Leptolyngbya sp. CCNP1308]